MIEPVVNYQQENWEIWNATYLAFLVVIPSEEDTYVATTRSDFVPSATGEAKRNLLVNSR